jgi:hypothetical protein
MSVNDAILATRPTSYWPLDDLGGSSSCRDEMGLHDALLPSAGITLSVLPFGTSQAPFFDGGLKSVLTIPDDPQYSQPFANALTVSGWLCSLALNNANVVGAEDKYVHYVEKAVAESFDAEWALRFYNQLDSKSDPPFAIVVLHVQPRLAHWREQWLLYGILRLEER